MDAAAFQREVTKERVINHDLQCTIFDEKRAIDYLKRQLVDLRDDLGKQLQDAHVTLGILQEDLKLARTTNVELEAQLKKKAEEVGVLKEHAFLTEATHQADVSCLLKRWKSGACRKL